MNEVIRASWMSAAACIGRDVNDFFRGSGQPNDDLAELCAGCPVLIECREYALADPYLHGYWAGMTALARRREASRRGDIRRRRPRADCGTNAGYFAHLRANESACVRCLEAHATYVAIYKENRTA